MLVLMRREIGSSLNEQGLVKVKNELVPNSSKLLLLPHLQVNWQSVFHLSHHPFMC